MPAQDSSKTAVFGNLISTVDPLVGSPHPPSGQWPKGAPSKLPDRLCASTVVRRHRKAMIRSGRQASSCCEGVLIAAHASTPLPPPWTEETDYLLSSSNDSTVTSYSLGLRPGFYAAQTQKRVTKAGDVTGTSHFMRTFNGSVGQGGKP